MAFPSKGCSPGRQVAGDGAAKRTAYPINKLRNMAIRAVSSPLRVAATAFQEPCGLRVSITALKLLHTVSCRLVRFWQVRTTHYIVLDVDLWPSLGIMHALLSCPEAYLNRKCALPDVAAQRLCRLVATIAHLRTVFMKTTQRLGVAELRALRHSPQTGRYSPQICGFGGPSLPVRAAKRHHG